MDLSEALNHLRGAHNIELASVLEPPVTRLPTPAEVDEAETDLDVIFHADYRRFLLEASDVVAGKLFPAVVTPKAGYRSLAEVATSAWNFVELSRDLLPICEDNADYFCMASSGQSPKVLYWSHNGTSEESWPDLAAWIMQVWLKKAQE